MKSAGFSLRRCKSFTPHQKKVFDRSQRLFSLDSRF